MFKFEKQEKQKTQNIHQNKSSDATVTLDVKLCVPVKTRSKKELLSSSSGIVRTVDSASPNLKKFNILKR